MACACGGSKTYVVTYVEGGQTVTAERRTEVEARALSIRKHGTYRLK